MSAEELSDNSLENFTDLDEESLRLVLSWRNNETVRKWSFKSDPISFDEHLSFVTSLKSNNSKVFMKVSDLGVFYLSDICPHTNSAKMGIYSNLGNSKRQKGQKILEAMKLFAVSTLKLKTIKLEVFSENIVALDFYLKSSFQEISRRIEHTHEGLEREVVTMKLEL